MLQKIPRFIVERSFHRSPCIFTRRLHQADAVPLAKTEYEPKHEATGNPFIILHGLFGSKSNW